MANVATETIADRLRRGDLFEKRRRLMDAWSGYVEKGETKNNGRVVEMRRA